MTTRKSMYWAAGGQITSVVITFIASVIMARILTPTEVGTYVVGAAFAGLCSAVTAFNIGAFITGETDLSRRTMDSAFTLNAVLSLALSLALVIGSQFADRVLDSADAARVVLLLAVQPAVGVFTFRPVTMLHRELHFQKISLVNVTSVLVGNTVAVGGAMTGQSFMSQAWGQITTSVVGAIGFQIVGARYLSFRIDLYRWREIVAFGVRMSAISGAYLTVARLSEIILARMLGLHALGIYSRASNLSGQIFENIYGVSVRVAFPQLAKEFRETGQLRVSFLHSLRLISGIMSPVLAGIAVLSPFLIGILYGPKWQAVALPLSFLLVANIIVLGFGMSWELFVVRRQTALQSRIELFRSVFGLVTFSAACLISVPVAAFSKVIDSVVGLAIYRKPVLRFSGASGSEMNKIMSETLVLTLFAILPAAGLMAFNGWSHTVSPIAVALAVLAGIAGWLVALRAFDHPIASEFRLLGSKIRSWIE